MINRLDVVFGSLIAMEDEFDNSYDGVRTVELSVTRDDTAMAAAAELYNKKNCYRATIVVVESGYGLVFENGEFHMMQDASKVITLITEHFAPYLP